MSQLGPQVIEITVEYKGTSRSRLVRILAAPVLALMVAAAVLLSTGGTGGTSVPRPVIVAPVPVSRCSIGTIPRVQAGYRPTEAADAHSLPSEPAGCH